MIQRRTVGIVGMGNVGVAAAYALFHRRLASDIVLIDQDARRAEGEAMDLMHGQSLVGRVTVRAGTYEDLADAQVVLISAGVPQRPGETRLDLLNRNTEVFREIARALDLHAPGAILVIAKNPVDILTWVMQELSHRPATPASSASKVWRGGCYGGGRKRAPRARTVRGGAQGADGGDSSIAEGGQGAPGPDGIFRGHGGHAPVRVMDREEIEDGW
jgi:hypothetical protein